MAFELWFAFECDCCGRCCRAKALPPGCYYCVSCRGAMARDDATESCGGKA